MSTRPREFLAGPGGARAPRTALLVAVVGVALVAGVGTGPARADVVNRQFVIETATVRPGQSVEATVNTNATVRPGQSVEATVNTNATVQVGQSWLELRAGLAGSRTLSGDYCVIADAGVGAGPYDYCVTADTGVGAGPYAR